MTCYFIGRYDHVQEKLKELKAITDQERNAALKERLKMSGRRKMNFCDLTLIWLVLKYCAKKTALSAEQNLINEQGNF